jgi:hypothetical protein
LCSHFDKLLSNFLFTLFYNERSEEPRSEVRSRGAKCGAEERSDERRSEVMSRGSAFLSILTWISSASKITLRDGNEKISSSTVMDFEDLWRDRLERNLVTLSPGELRLISWSRGARTRT